MRRTGARAPDHRLDAEYRRNGRFFNPWGEFREKSLRDVWRFLTESRPRRRTPAGPIPVLQNDGRDLAGVQHSSRVTWAGHATVVIHDGADVIVTDPHFGERALVPRRKTPPGIPLAALPPHTIGVLSHNHYDHLDEFTVLRLPAAMRWFVPTGLKHWFAQRGRHNVTELGWWESARCGKWEFTCVPAQHWSRRIGQDTNSTLWCGWVMRSATRSYYFAGDTGYFHGFAEIARRHGAPDVALLPIGAYEPRWFMAYQHMNPAEAVQAFRDLGARFMVPIHWGTFDLAWEALDQPVHDLGHAIGEQGVDPATVRVLAIGEGWHLP